MTRTARFAAAAVALALGATAAVATAVPAAADPQHVVTTTADSGEGSLRDAIADSHVGDEIVFDPTAFAAPQVIETLSAIIVPHDLTITGPGPDLLTIQRNDAANVHPLFILSGSGSGQTDVDVTITGMTLDDEPGDSLLDLRQAIFSNVFSALGDVTLRDLVILDQDSSVAANFGGAVAIVGADAVSLTDVEFSNNSSDTTGGALAVQDADSLTLVRTEFRGNAAHDGNGGAVAAIRVGTISITDSVFRFNEAEDVTDSGGYGGALFVAESGSLSVTGSTFGSSDPADQNTAENDGGGIAVFAVTDDVTVSDSQFLSNDAGGFGGGLYIGEIDALVVENSEFDGNLASDGGAVYVDDPAEASSITGSTFVTNVADNRGGAITFASLDEHPITISTSTFRGNEIGSGDFDVYGGAVYVASDQVDSLLTIERSTFSEQGRRGDGDALGLSIAYGELHGEFRLVNSTLDEHELGDGDRFAVYFDYVSPGATAAHSHSTMVSNNGVVGAAAVDGVITLEHSILVNEQEFGADVVDADALIIAGSITAAWSLFSQLPDPADVTMLDGNLAPIDPDLGPLQDNGGPTFTREPLTGSPAIGAGDPNVGGAPATDQRGPGFARVVGVIDIGAVEIAAPALPATGATVSPLLPALGGIAMLLGLAAVAGRTLSRRPRAG